MPIFIKENQELKDNMYKIPNRLYKKLKCLLSKYGNYTQYKGYKRLNALVNPEYNKRSDKANQFKNGKYISFTDLKRIKHDFKHMSDNPNDINNILNGGKDMEIFVDDTLNRERTKVAPVLKQKKVETRNKNKVKPSIKPMKPLKLGNINANVHESKYLNENLDNHPYYDYILDYNAYEIFNAFENNKNVWLPLINPNMYQKALNEFTKHGKLINFPTKYIYQWMGIIMKNTAILSKCTEICGHSQFFPTDDFVDYYFNYDYDEWENYKKSIDEDDDYYAAWEFLEQKGFDEWNKLPDGSDAISDYGIKPLEKIISEYNNNSTPEETLIIINKCLDIMHMRGDLASMFITGGSKILSQISEEINKRKYKKIYINEEQLKKLKDI